jgi:hypothetical protein
MPRLIDALALLVALGMLACAVLYVILSWSGMTP